MKRLVFLFIIATFLQSIVYANTITLTFDDAINGAPFYNFDLDGDGSADVIFSTTDDNGFSTFGPGPNQLYIQEPGIEGTTSLSPDLRVDFLRGAVGTVSFGTALLWEGDSAGHTFSVFNADNSLIGFSDFTGNHTDTSSLDLGDEFEGVFEGASTFPEALVSVALDDDEVGAYGLWDYNQESAERYIIDNFTFESAGEDVISKFTGALPEDPLLPVGVSEEGVGFIIDGEIVTGGFGDLFPVFIDPEIATGYTYEVTTGQFFASVLIPSALPNGDSEFSITIDGTDYDLTAGTVFDIPFSHGDVTEFQITGIDIGEALDPTDPLAFVTGLTFNGSGEFTVIQTPIVFNTDPPMNTIPEPSTFLLFAIGLLTAAGSRRKKRSVE